MSSIDLNPHLICVSWRGGKQCRLDERCLTCVDWSDERMNAYTKHVLALERKRKSKANVKEQKRRQIDDHDDFALLCTGGQGSTSTSDNLIESRVVLR